MKYFVFVLGLGACMFDPKATGPGYQSSPQTVDGSVAGDGTDSVGGMSGGAGTGGDIGVGTGAVSGGSAGMAGASGAEAGASGSGVPPMAGASGGPPPPPPLANGEICAEDARCASGHCDGICCDKGAECCRDVSDCSTQPGGLGMSCDDRTNCQGTAGKITCTSEFKCVTVNGTPDDRACTNRVEADDCGYYLSAFCLGGQEQSGAPECATSCSSDAECDVDAHCSDGECVADLPNGEPCTRPEDCAAGFCKNIVDGVGVCCGLLGDCCKTPDDCPDAYRRAPQCNDLQSCRGTETVAECNFNICSSRSRPANQACNGMVGPTCGPFQDVVCMMGRNNQCRTTCSNNGHCDTDTAFCDNGRCVEKRDNGGQCTMGGQCKSGACSNNVCCPPGLECCTQVEQCTANLNPRCGEECQGTRNSVSCTSNRCEYGQPVDDDSACATGGSACGLFADIQCNGQSQQLGCRTECGGDDDCDSNAECNATSARGMCVRRMGGNGGMSGQGGASGSGGEAGEGEEEQEASE